MEIVLVAALGNERQLGLDNQLLWQLPGDLPRFKAMTMGCPIVMGRKTYDSIGRPLPGRTNIVITRDKQCVIDGVETVNSTEQALKVALIATQNITTQNKEANEAESNVRSNKVFIIGGGEIYSLFLPLASGLELTLVNDSPKADAFFPEYSDQFQEISRQPNQADDLHYDYVSYRRNTE